VHFDRGEAGSGDRVPDSDRCVGVGSGIDNEGFVLLSGNADGVHDIPFMVRLQEFHGRSQLYCQRRHLPVYLFQRCAPVHIGFAFTQKVQVRPIDNKNVCHDPTSLYCSFQLTTTTH
jgi:hypothetical protein